MTGVQTCALPIFLQAGSQGIPSWALGAGDVRIAILDYNERTLRILDRGPTLELGRSELEVAQGKSDRSLRTIVLGGERYRVVAVPTQQSGLALIIAQPLVDQDRTLRRLGWVTVAFGVFGVLAAGLAEPVAASLRESGVAATVCERVDGNPDIACVEAAAAYGTPGNYVNGANIAGFLKVANAMMDQGVV